MQISNIKLDLFFSFIVCLRPWSRRWWITPYQICNLKNVLWLQVWFIIFCHLKMNIVLLKLSNDGGEIFSLSASQLHQSSNWIFQIILSVFIVSQNLSYGERTIILFNWYIEKLLCSSKIMTCLLRLTSKRYNQNILANLSCMCHMIYVRMIINLVLMFCWAFCKIVWITLPLFWKYFER